MDAMVTAAEEQVIYLDKLYNVLLEHRYRYYVLHDPVYSDNIYDWIERHYNDLAQKSGVKTMDMVDFNSNDPLAILAKERVDSRFDSESLWEKSMESVWSRLGRSKKEAKREAKDK